MEIKHERIQTVLLALAARVGQAAAAAMITEKYHQLGGGNLPLVAGRIWNNQQNIYHRWIEGNTPQQRAKIRELVPAIEAAVEAEREERLSEACQAIEAELHDEHSLIANANRECTEATNAVLMRKPKAVIHREGIEAISALAELIGINIDLPHAQQRAA